MKVARDWRNVVIQCQNCLCLLSTVTWMKGVRDITNSQRSLKETIDDYVRLTLKRAVVADAGTYCILAKNVYGCDRAFFTVTVCSLLYCTILQLNCKTKEFINKWKTAFSLQRRFCSYNCILLYHWLHVAADSTHVTDSYKISVLEYPVCTLRVHKTWARIPFT